MKLAVTGKGGVGKTTVSALIAHQLKASGLDVIAIDADPDANLAACLGYTGSKPIEPLVHLKALIEERTGVKPGTTGGMFRLNPFVEDIPDQYAVDVAGIRLLVAGAVKKGGSGCYCPENTMIRALVSHLLLERDDALVLDMEAGIEHLSRGTIRGVDHLLVVLEPSRRSVETAQRIYQLASDIGLKSIICVGNKIRSAEDQKFLESAMPEARFLAFIPYDDNLREADMAGATAAGVSPAAEECIRALAGVLEQTPAATPTSD